MQKKKMQYALNYSGTLKIKITQRQFPGGFRLLKYGHPVKKEDIPRPRVSLTPSS